MSRIWLACLPLVAACRDQVNVSASNGTTGSGSTSSSTSGGACAGVCGTMINRYFVESGPPVDVPVDLTAVPIEAMVWQGSKWATFMGAGAADGSFSVSGVPSGELVLRAGGLYVRTGSRTLDLGTEILGRQDAVQAALLGKETAYDSISASLQNLVPGESGGWKDTVGLFNINGDGCATLYPPAGATSVGGGSAAYQGGLVDGSKGDVLHIYQQHVADAASPYAQSTIVRHAAIEGLEQQHGTMTVSAALVDVAASANLTVDFRGSEFAAQVSAISQSMGFISSGLSVLAVPGATQAPAIWSPAVFQIGGPGVVSLFWYDSSCTDVTLTSLPYGNPFPSSWGSTVFAYQLVQSAYPAGSFNYWASGAVSVWMPLDEATAGPIRPQVTPVQNLRIAGQDAFGTPTSTGLLPTITWDAPTLGTPSAFRVAVWSGQCAHPTSWGCAPDATVVTTDTSVVMPPGVLTSGMQYQIVVTAEVSPVDVGTAPFRHGARLASADAVSNLATP